MEILLVEDNMEDANVTIQALKQGIQRLKTELQQDSLAAKRVQIAIVSFNSTVNVEQDFVPPDALNPPSLSADRLTKMG